MRSLNELPYHRHPHPITGWLGDHGNGAWVIPSPIDGQGLRVMASDGYGWEHVSVSRATRCPNWPEMAFIKTLFFADDEVVMQLHPPAKDHINFHPNCLHLWRPTRADIPRPPSWMIGPGGPDGDDVPLGYPIDWPLYTGHGPWRDGGFDGPTGAD